MITEGSTGDSSGKPATGATKSAAAACGPHLADGWHSIPMVIAIGGGRGRGGGGGAARAAAVIAYSLTFSAGMTTRSKGEMISRESDPAWSGT